MATTAALYATSAAGAGLGGRASAWANTAGAVGAPNGDWAANSDRTAGGQQALTLGGYQPQTQVLATTAGVVPYSIEYLQVQVTFSIDDAASNFDDVSVLLLHADGTPFARTPLYLLTAGDGLTVQGNVNFIGHAGYGNSPLGWADLAGLQVQLVVTRSGAAGPDTFRVDAVGVVTIYTLAAPGDPTAQTLAGTGVELRVYDRAGTRLEVLPWSTLTRTIVRNAVGALTATVPRGLIADGVLDGERYLRIAVNGIESTDWYLLDDDADDDADAGGVMRPTTIAGTGVGEMLDWGVTYSWEYDPVTRPSLLGLDPTHPFADKTPGFILGELLTQAKARGCFPQLTWSFTADVDSAGRGWPATYSKSYDLGITIAKVLSGMSDSGWVDWEMRQFSLDVYAPGTALAVDEPGLVLRLGKGVAQAPRKRTRKTARSTILANGDQGATVEVSDPDALATWGRREAYEGRSGVTDYGTLQATTAVSLSRQTTASEAVTLVLDPFALPAETPALPRPGGFVRYDQRRLSPTQLEPMRVQSIAWDYGPDQPRVSVELNDLWVDADVKRGRQIDALLNGSSANERVPTTPAGDDGVPPGPVSGLAVTSTAYIDARGQTFAQATATWIQAAANANGTAMDDLRCYDLEWKQPDVIPGSQLISTPNVVTLWQWSGLVAGAALWTRIRAADRYGNPGAWSGWVLITAGDDVTPPPQPTTPTVDNYLGLLRIGWDGAFVGGSARPADLRRVEVHTGAAAGFTVDTRSLDAGGTLAGTLVAAGPVFLEVPYGQTRYAKLVAVDVTGNRSLVSGEASGASTQILGPDVFDGAVGTAKLADLAVKTAKIDLLAVNTAQVGSLDVGKLVAGTMTAQVVVGGSLSTAANPASTGGVQLNSLGIYAWAPPVGGAAPQQTVAIDTQGNATLVGTFRTARTGRRIELGVAGTLGRVQFYSATGVSSALYSYTEGTGLEALQLAIGSDSLINLNTDNWTTYNAWKHQVGFRDQVAFTGLGKDIGQVVINDSGNGYASPRLALVNYQSFATNLKFYYQGPGNVAHLEVRNGLDTDFAPIWASAFTPSSDLAGKTGVRVLPAAEKRRMLDDLLGLDVHGYRRRAHTHVPRLLDGGGHELVETGAPEEIGLIAQTAPAQITVSSGESLGIDLYQMTTMVLAALQASHTELSGRLAALEKNGTRA